MSVGVWAVFRESLLLSFFLCCDQIRICTEILSFRRPPCMPSKSTHFASCLDLWWAGGGRRRNHLICLGMCGCTSNEQLWQQPPHFVGLFDQIQWKTLATGTALFFAGELAGCFLWQFSNGNQFLILVGNCKLSICCDGRVNKNQLMDGQCKSESMDGNCKIVDWVRVVKLSINRWKSCHCLISCGVSVPIGFWCF